MISFRKTSQGAWELSALVTDKETPVPYYDHAQYMGYTRTEAKYRFLDDLKAKGKRLVEEVKKRG